jgi:hypothetical protein
MLSGKFIRDYPVLFHMTRAGVWPLIQKHGLLSTAAICESLELSEAETLRHLRTYRSEKIRLGEFVLRDNKPLRQRNLARNLHGSGLTCEDWHEMLNRRVFFSTKTEFVAKLRQSYLSDPVTIIAVDTARLLQSHLATIDLSSKNSGAARMPTHMKSRETFIKFEKFSLHLKSKPKELTVYHSVPDLEQLTVKVYELPAWKLFRP